MRHESSVAGEIGAEELFQLGAATPWSGATYQCNEEVSMHRGCLDGSCLCQDILAEMEATTVASPDSDGSRVPAEHYFQEVLQGALVIETQCSKDAMFE